MEISSPCFGILYFYQKRVDKDSLWLRLPERRREEQLQETEYNGSPMENSVLLYFSYKKARFLSWPGF